MACENPDAHDEERHTEWHDLGRGEPATAAKWDSEWRENTCKNKNIRRANTSANLFTYLFYMTLKSWFVGLI